MPAVYETLRARYEPGHTVLVASTLAFAARVLRETHGGSLVTIHLAPNLFRSLEVPVHAAGGPLLVHAPKWLRRAFWWLIDRAAIDPVLAPALNDFRRQLGLRAPVRRVFRDWIHSPDRVIGLFPDWFAPPRSDWPEQARLTGFPLYDAADHEPVPDGLAEFLAAGPPPVLFAPGSVNTAAGEFFATSLAACEKAGRRAILVSRYGSQTERTLPAWARHFSYLPFSTVLPRMSAFVSHGGIGSISQGLRAGVPQLVRPMGFDQFENGALVERLGVARMLPVRRYTPDTVAAALDALAAAECAQACRSVADRFNGMDGLAAAAAIIEQTATR
jgi:UDP:flavonoid glycosyltransferase YjiC (YdhE family)